MHLPAHQHSHSTNVQSHCNTNLPVVSITYACRVRPRIRALETTLWRLTRRVVAIVGGFSGHLVSSNSHHLFVCTSCRHPGDVKSPLQLRAGGRLFSNLTKQFEPWARRTDFVIVPYECLSVCPRPCAIALRAPGKFTYVFGDIKPGQTESAIIECANLYRRAPTGFLPREHRPAELRAGILARVPPLETP